MPLPMDHLLSHDSRDLQVVDGVWNHTHTVAQYKGPHPTYIMYACARLVLWRSLHHLSASSCPHALWVMTHETSGSWIHPSPWQRVWSYPRDAVQHLMEYGTYTKMQGLWPLQASTPCTGVTHKEGNSFVRLSELHLVNALAGSSSLELSRAESLPMDPCSSGSCLCVSQPRDHNQREYVTLTALWMYCPFFGYSPSLHLRLILAHELMGPI